MPSIFVSPAAPRDTPSVAAEPSFLAEYVYFPFYDFVVRFYPCSWVPNKVTLFGVSATLLSSCLLLASMPATTAFSPAYAALLPASQVVQDRESIRYTPLYPGEADPVFPSLFTARTLLTLCGILNLVYCLADNTDGRLARRDGKTSVIGEYLDHGLDCVTSLLSAALAFAVMGVSISNMSISLILIALATVLSHTLHFERNIFVWGNRIASVDEAMIFFGVCMWIPLAFPQEGSTFIDEVPWLMRAGELLHVDKVFPQFTTLKGIELVYIFYSLTQAQTILGMAARHWRMVFRLQTLFMLANGAVLLSMIPSHTAHVAAYQAAHGGAGSAVPGYTLGRFTYPAVWIITTACTCSTIVHVAIAARCARLPYPDFVPLGALFLVWFTFLTCPVGAAVLAVVIHVVQVLVNVRSIKERSARWW